MASSGALEAVAPPLSASTLSRHQSHESTKVSKSRTISLSLELAGASCQRKAEDLSHVSTASSLRILPAAYEQSVGTIAESPESEYERTMRPFASLATISIPSTRIVNEDEPSVTRSGYPTDFRKCSSLSVVIVALSTIGFSSTFSNLLILYHFSPYPSMPKPTKTTLSESAFQISSCRKSSIVNSGILSPSSSSDAFLIVIVAVNFTLPIMGSRTC